LGTWALEIVHGLDLHVRMLVMEHMMVLTLRPLLENRFPWDQEMRGAGALDGTLGCSELSLMVFFLNLRTARVTYGLVPFQLGRACSQTQTSGEPFQPFLHIQQGIQFPVDEIQGVGPIRHYISGLVFLTCLVVAKIFFLDVL